MCDKLRHFLNNCGLSQRISPIAQNPFFSFKSGTRSFVFSLGLIFATFSFAQSNDLEVEPAENEDKTAAATSSEPVVTIEQIIVTAQRPIGALRLELETLRASFFSDYNELNTNDEFDVVCEKTNFTHTRIQQELCLPQFFKDLMAEETRMAFINGNFSGIQNMSQMATLYSNKFEELSANILAVANENPGLAQSLLDVGRIEAAIRSKQEECMEGPGFLFFRLCK